METSDVKSSEKLETKNNIKGFDIGLLLRFELLTR